jgi:hypothetical protein
MNIMLLVSVAERTREIGIRKAIGARRSHNHDAFSHRKACVLSILGGLIGLGLSALGLQIYGLIADTTISMEGVAAMGRVLFCVIIGVAFGSYPAAKASKMTPIDALQNETRPPLRFSARGNASFEPPRVLRPRGSFFSSCFDRERAALYNEASETKEHINICHSFPTVHHHEKGQSPLQF